MSRAERGLSAPSLGSLLAWTKALDITVAALFEASQERLNEPSRVPAFTTTGAADYLLTPREEMRFEVFEEHLEPSRSPDQRFWSVDAEFAFVYVVRGALEIEFDRSERKVNLLAGGLHVYAPREPHRWKNMSGGLTVLLIFESPARRF